MFSLVVSQPSCSYRCQSACLSIVVCDAGDTDYRGEEGIFLWIHQHLSRHQKHTAVIMQVSLQQKLCRCQLWGRCNAISAAWAVTLLPVLPPSPFLIFFFFFFLAAAREMVCIGDGIKWNKILLRRSSCQTKDFCWARRLGLGRVIACLKDSRSDDVSQITGSNPPCMGEEMLLEDFVSAVTVLL